MHSFFDSKHHYLFRDFGRAGKEDCRVFFLLGPVASGHHCLQLIDGWDVVVAKECVNSCVCCMLGNDTKTN